MIDLRDLSDEELRTLVLPSGTPTPQPLPAPASEQAPAPAPMVMAAGGVRTMSEEELRKLAGPHAPQPAAPPRTPEELPQGITSDTPISQDPELMRQQQAVVERFRRRNAPGGIPSPTPTPGIDDLVRAGARGIPFVGSYADEASAAANAALNPVIGTGAPGATFRERYNTNVEAERARDKAFDVKHPIASQVAQIGGGAASGLGLSRVAPTIMGIVPGGLFGRTLAGGAAGGAQGAIYGFGEGEGTAQDRYEHGKRGAIIGGGLGSVIPAVASGTVGLANALRNWRVGSDLAADLGVPRAAVTRVAGNVADDALTPATAAARGAELGPAGMTLDMGRQLGGRAEAVANMPGRGQTRIATALEDRARTSPVRIEQALDAEMGRSPNLVQVAENIERHYNARAAPLYASVMNGHPQVWDSTLQGLTSRPSIRTAINNATELAREQGVNIQNPFIQMADGTLQMRPGVTPSLRFWDYVKKSMDGRIGAFSRAADLDSAGKASMGSLMDTRRLLVDHLDNLTGGAYANARAMSAEKFNVQEALEHGVNVFKNQMLPEQFGELLQGMNPIERGAVAAGARRALQRISENAPANITEGGRQVFRELLQGGEQGDSAQKLRLLFGNDVTDRIMQMARREQGFDFTLQRTTGNSRTAVRQELQADMTERQLPTTFTGATNRLIAAPVVGPINAALREGMRGTREGVADLLTRRGQARDLLVRRLMDYNDRVSNPAISRDAAQALLFGELPQAQKPRYPYLDERR